MVTSPLVVQLQQGPSLGLGGQPYICNNRKVSKAIGLPGQPVPAFGVGICKRVAVIYPRTEDLNDLVLYPDPVS